MGNSTTTKEYDVSVIEMFREEPARFPPLPPPDPYLSKISRLIPDREFWYLAGPMTNRPAFNFPAFDAAAAFLREQGYAISSPAEYEHEQIRSQLLSSVVGAEEEQIGPSWTECLARDLIVVSHPRCIGIFLLPEWYESRGALLETHVADDLGKPLFEFDLERAEIIKIDRRARLSEIENALC